MLIQVVEMFMTISPHCKEGILVLLCPCLILMGVELLHSSSFIINIIHFLQMHTSVELELLIYITYIAKSVVPSILFVPFTTTLLYSFHLLPLSHFLFSLTLSPSPFSQPLYHPLISHAGVDVTLQNV